MSSDDPFEIRGDGVGDLFNTQLLPVLYNQCSGTTGTYTCPRGREREIRSREKEVGEGEKEKDGTIQNQTPPELQNQCSGNFKHSYLLEGERD